MSIHTINRPVSVPTSVPERVVVDVSLDHAIPASTADEAVVAELVDDETLVE